MKTKAITPLRREIARTACFEIDNVARMLLDYVESLEDGDVPASMRGCLMRVSRLSDVIYECALSDEDEESDEDMIEAVGGRKALGTKAMAAIGESGAA